MNKYIDLNIDRITQDGHWQDVSMAEKDLIRYGEESVDKVVARMLKSDELFKRTISVRILGEIGGENATQALVEALETETDRDCERSIKSTLHRLGHFDAPDIDGLESTNKIDIIHAVGTFVYYPDYDDHFRSLIDHPNPVVRGSFFRMLARPEYINDPEIPDFIEKGLKERDESVLVWVNALQRKLK